MGNLQTYALPAGHALSNGCGAPQCLAGGAGRLRIEYGGASWIDWPWDWNGMGVDGAGLGWDGVGLRGVGAREGFTFAILHRRGLPIRCHRWAGHRRRAPVRHWRVNRVNHVNRLDRLVSVLGRVDPQRAAKRVQSALASPDHIYVAFSAFSAFCGLLCCALVVVVMVTVVAVVRHFILYPPSSWHTIPPHVEHAPLPTR